MNFFKWLDTFLLRHKNWVTVFLILYAITLTLLVTLFSRIAYSH